MAQAWKKHKKLWITLICILSVCLCIFCAGAIYVGIYYHAEDEAIAAMATQENYTVRKDGNLTVFAPEAPACGLIFYPGGKVEETAYAPLLKEFAERNVLCVLVKMPFRLAVLKQNAANGIREKFPEITQWAIGGHSLGGAIAASYLSSHTAQYCGIALFGAYSAADLSGSGLKAVSVYGTQDLVLNRKKYEANRKNLPQDFHELVIEGGCHSYFGSYGMQKGDGTPTLSRREQMQRTAEFTIANLFSS